MQKVNSCILVVAWGFFHCSMWDLVPWPRIEPWPPELQHRVLATGLAGKALYTFNYAELLSILRCLKCCSFSQNYVMNLVSHRGHSFYWADPEWALQPYLLLCFRLVFQKKSKKTSLVVQWFRICLPRQATWVRSLVWENPTCHGATKCVHCNTEAIPCLGNRVSFPRNNNSSSNNERKMTGRGKESVVRTYLTSKISKGWTD